MYILALPCSQTQNYMPPCRGIAWSLYAWWPLIKQKVCTSNWICNSYGPMHCFLEGNSGHWQTYKFGESFSPIVSTLSLCREQSGTSTAAMISAVSLHAAHNYYNYCSHKLIQFWLYIKVIIILYYISIATAIAYYEERPASAAIEKKIDFLSASKWFGESYSLMWPLSSTIILHNGQKKLYVGQRNHNNYYVGH